MTAAHDYDPPSRHDLAIELGLAHEPAVTRKSLRQSYGGLRVDEYGYDRDGNYYPSLDGGGQGD